MTTLPRDLLATAGLLLALASASSAQGTFDTLPVLPFQANDPPGLGNPAQDVADLDGDGRLDVAVQLVDDASVAAILQTVDGGYVAGPVTSLGLDTGTLAGLEPVGLRLVDLDGDDVVDLVAAGGSTASVFRGDGDGGFTFAHSYPVGDGVVDLEVAFVDGDGFPDVITLGELAGSFTVLLGDGDGSFGAVGQTPVGDGARSFALGDLDGDSHLDVIVARQALAFTGFAIFLGAGDGSFLANGGVVMSDNAEDTALGDLDGDGFLDAVVSSSFAASEQLGAWAPGNGDGTFASPVELTLPGETFDGAILAIADVDEDGDDDLAWRTSWLLRVALNDGAGLFELAGSFFAYGGALDVHDMTGDGDLDLVAAAQLFGDTVLQVPQGNGSGQFRWSRPLGVVNRFADLDDDGQIDVVTPTYDDGWFLRAARGLGGGFFGAPVDLEAPYVWAGAGDVADFDGDGNVDFVGVLSTESGVETVVWFGDGALGFAPGPPLPIQDWIHDLLATDLDGDGDVDVAASRDTTIRVMLNNGSGVFGNASNVPFESDQTRLLEAGDFTGDGIVDLVTTHELGAEKIRVLPGNGDGTFGTFLDTSASIGDTSLAAADFDEDGDLDLLVPAEGPQAVVHFNDGDGFFGTSVSLPMGTEGRGVAAGDIDGDGHVDAVATYGARVQTYAGDGLGGFAPPVTFDAYGLSEVEVRDIDGDGAADIVTTSGALQTFLNRDGPWTNAGPPLAGTQGLPKLVGSGSLLPGSTFRQTLSDARPGSISSWYFGISELSAPFKGGVFVPSPDLLVPVFTDADGDWTFAFPWPAGLGGGYPLWFQVWLSDPAGVFGFASSNGLRADVP